MENELTAGQQEFYDAVLNGESVFLNGKAGTGKTYVTKQVIEELKKKGKNVVALAPTGVAANNLGGATMHSVFALPVHEVIQYDNCKYVKSNKRRLWEKIDVLLIDEVSMVRADMIDGINWSMRKNSCPGLTSKQVIFIGDMGQLPPVASDNFKAEMTRKGYGGVFFYFAEIIKSMDLRTIELEEVKRQSDPEFIRALNMIREGKKDSYFKRFHHTAPKGIILAPHKTTVNRYNIDGLEMLQGETYTFKAETDGNIKMADFNFDEIINVKHGCKIMYLVNSKDNGLVNGTIGTLFVQKKSEEHDERFFILLGSVKFEITQAEVTKKEYVLDELRDELVLKTIGTIKQMPIRLAYAITIHKSQGLTFDEMTVDLSEPCFSPGQLYVALSRASTPDGLRIITGNRILK